MRSRSNAPVARSRARTRALERERERKGLRNVSRLLILLPYGRDTSEGGIIFAPASLSLSARTLTARGSRGFRETFAAFRNERAVAGKHRASLSSKKEHRSMHNEHKLRRLGLILSCIAHRHGELVGITRRSYRVGGEHSTRSRFAVSPRLISRRNEIRLGLMPWEETGRRREAHVYMTTCRSSGRSSSGSSSQRHRRFKALKPAQKGRKTRGGPI